jgi:hypothetical protein
MTTEQYTARRWVCRRRYAWNIEKNYEKLEGKAIYHHPPVNQPQPHDTHKITHSMYHRQATMYLFMTFVHYNDWSRRLTNTNIWIPLKTLANGFLFSQKCPDRRRLPLLSSRLHKLFSDWGKNGTSRGDPSPKSSVTVRGAEHLLHYASMPQLYKQL